jgi:formamidopyrimidine-DNA glycosylase
VGLSIEKTAVFWDRTIATPSVSEFCARLIGQAILQISRRGKFIVFKLNQDTLLVHLRMTGKFTLSKNPEPVSSHERLQLQLEDGRVLHYEDQRKFGKWYLFSDPGSHLSGLGLEPLSKEFTFERFEQLLKKSSQQIKPFLLNQKHIAGLGNIYADEALWAAKIHPERKANSLSVKQIKELYAAIPNVLLQGIAHMGTSLGSKQANYFSVSGRRGGNQAQLKVFRRNGLPCPRCQAEIVKIFVAQRGTHLCPNCQK